MKMEKSKDPQTSITQVRPRIVGKGEPPPKASPPPPPSPGTERWSLNDFS